MDIIKLMINTNEGWTAMHYAYRSGHDNVIELLKKNGVSSSEKDNKGWRRDIQCFING